MNNISFTTSWGALLTFTPPMTVDEVRLLGIECKEWQGYADLSHSSAIELAHKRSMRLPTSAELFELHLWLNQQSDHCWPPHNIYRSSTSISEGEHYSVRLKNGKSYSINDSYYGFVSCVYDS
ncbi:hypothetical protein [Shewanella pneumatophori]|uniref:Uncharacterized protein n=1 Tax=Shewanella pneumatophori TaxID=314092 RepID=A0A9X1ZHF9_9GAMM|nr:hypothetical protein [Shewanella pneumatophori]MCL1139950.1 hypothetical protein [Shewanella pneumatophori]